MLPWLQSLFRVVFACSTSTIFIWSVRQPEWNQTAGNRPLPQKPKATPALDPDIMILTLTWWPLTWPFLREVLELLWSTREWKTWLGGGGGGELEERKRCGWGRVAIKSSIYDLFYFYFLLDARNLVMSVWLLLVSLGVLLMEMPKLGEKALLKLNDVQSDVQHKHEWVRLLLAIGWDSDR